MGEGSENAEEGEWLQEHKLRGRALKTLRRESGFRNTSSEVRGVESVREKAQPSVLDW